MLVAKHGFDKTGVPRNPHKYKLVNVRNANSDNPKESSGLRRSPIPHLRRGHERVVNGQRTWIRDMLINVRSEDDIAFVDKRIAYVVK